jgi:hypothetical protein
MGEPRRIVNVPEELESALCSQVKVELVTTQVKFFRPIRVRLFVDMIVPALAGNGSRKINVFRSVCTDGVHQSIREFRRKMLGDLRSND